MSHTVIDQATPRLHRSELAVPGCNPEFFAKAARSAADVVVLDLEDAVAPEDKDRARRDVVAALNEVDWGEKTLSVRVNGLDTRYMYQDLITVVEQCPRLDTLLIPKVGVPADLYAVDMLLSQIEQGLQRKRPVGLAVLIETALGMANIEAIAAGCRRLEAMSFGVADFAASTRARTTVIGGAHPQYGVLTGEGADGQRSFHWNDMWHYAQARLVTACRAYGLRPIDGPYGDIGDPEGFLAAARRAAILGCEGKWAIHPSQVGLANQVFTPTAEELAQARRIIAAMQEAARRGRGAVSLDGRLIDTASIRMAQALLQKAERIAGAGGEHG